MMSYEDYLDDQRDEGRRQRRECNRHEDCDAAEKTYRERTGQVVPAGFHCRDDCCEECFGS